MNTIIGGSNYSVWLGGIEYILDRSCAFGFDADTAQGVELSKRISLEKLQEAAIQLGYFPCKDISIEPGTCMGSENVVIGDSCNMPEAAAQEAFVALGKQIVGKDT